MCLAEEGQGADALNDVVFPAVRGQFVMDGKAATQGNARHPFFKRLPVVGLQVKTFREKLRPIGDGTDRQQPLGIDSEKSIGLEVVGVLQMTFDLSPGAVCLRDAAARSAPDCRFKIRQRF